VTARGRELLLKAVQYGIALAALAYLLAQVDIERTLSMFASLEPLVVALLLGVTAFEFLSRFSMWHVLLNGRHRTAFVTTARLDLVIKFINHVIPSKASGHSIAPLVVRHYTDHDWTESVTVAALNTGLYATLYGVVALVGLGLFVTRLPSGLTLVVVLSTAMYLVAGVLILFAGRRLELAAGLFDWLEGLATRVPMIGGTAATLVGKLPSFTEDSAGVFRDLSTRPTVVGVYALGWTGNLVVFPGIRVLVLLDAFGTTFTPAVLLPLALVMAYSVTVLPLTPGGVGVAEASATLVLVSLGVPESAAVAAILVDRTLGVYLPALLGWLPMVDLDLGELTGSET